MSALVLLATRSVGKLRELAPLLADLGLEARTLDAVGIAETPDEAAIEAFDTFEENALAKARHFHARSGLPTVADDSGLAVDALGGRPGVRSKRWSGRDDLAGPALDDANNGALLAALAGVHERRAHYVCVAAYVDGARELVGRGETHGVIAHTPSGREGFGYDPYFLSDDLGCSFGVAPLSEKQRVSHRARAVRALLAQLASHG